MGDSSGFELVPHGRSVRSDGAAPCSLRSDLRSQPLAVSPCGGRAACYPTAASAADCRRPAARPPIYKIPAGQHTCVERNRAAAQLGGQTGEAQDRMGEALALQLRPRDSGIDRAPLVVPDRVDPSTAAGNHAPQLGVVGEGVERPILKLMKELVVHSVPDEKQALEGQLKEGAGFRRSPRRPSTSSRSSAPSRSARRTCTGTRPAPRAPGSGRRPSASPERRSRASADRLR